MHSKGDVKMPGGKGIQTLSYRRGVSTVCVDDQKARATPLPRCPSLSVPFSMTLRTLARD